MAMVRVASRFFMQFGHSYWLSPSRLSGERYALTHCLTSTSLPPADVFFSAILVCLLPPFVIPSDNLASVQESATIGIESSIKSSLRFDSHLQLQHLVTYSAVPPNTEGSKFPRPPPKFDPRSDSADRLKDSAILSKSNRANFAYSNNSAQHVV